MKTLLRLVHSGPGRLTAWMLGLLLSPESTSPEIAMHDVTAPEPPPAPVNPFQPANPYEKQHQPLTPSAS